jgi:hypothetical protein
MSESTFDQVLWMHCLKLHMGIAMSNNNSAGGLGGVIIPKVLMAIGVCLLAGVTYIDLTTAYGGSELSVFLSGNIFVDAVNTCDTLNIVFPEIEGDLKQYNQDIKPRVHIVL